MNGSAENLLKNLCVCYADSVAGGAGEGCEELSVDGAWAQSEHHGL